MAREVYIDDMNYITVPARLLREGDVLSYANPRWNTRIDEVSTTRDGMILVRVGEQGTGTEWFGPEDLIQILPR